MLAKDRHRINLLKYLANWDNPFPKRIEMHGILGIKRSTLRKHFTTDDLTEIENEGLELRKKRSARPRAEVYSSMLEEAKDGNVPAQKEFLTRTEGNVIEKREIGFDKDTAAAWATILNVTGKQDPEKLPNGQ